MAPERKRSDRTRKRKTKGTMGASKPRKSATKSKSRASINAVRGMSEGKPAESTSRRIDQRSRELEDWREATLALMRALILEADPEMIEEWKWMGTPVWSHHGIVCTGEASRTGERSTRARSRRS